jgi:hypothetical protein
MSLRNFLQNYNYTSYPEQSSSMVQILLGNEHYCCIEQIGLTYFTSQIEDLRFT